MCSLIIGLCVHNYTLICFLVCLSAIARDRPPVYGSREEGREVHELEAFFVEEGQGRPRLEGAWRIPPLALQGGDRP